MYCSTGSVAIHGAKHLGWALQQRAGVSAQLLALIGRDAVVKLCRPVLTILRFDLGPWLEKIAIAYGVPRICEYGWLAMPSMASF